MSNRRAALYLAVIVATVTLVGSRPARADGAFDGRTAPFEKIVAFGDSLSDPGNLFVSTGQFSIRPFQPIPSAPYAIGGFHFTNGETWVERLSRELKTPSATGPALRTPGLFTNYAFGAARARAGSSSPTPDLTAQVAAYLADFHGMADPDFLYVIWFGANDIRDALESLGNDPSGATATGIVQAAIGAIGENVLTLWNQGGRSFLVPNEPNVAISPAVASQPPAVQAAAAQLSAAYDAALDQLLTSLGGLPEARIYRLDVFTIVNAIYATPSAYGLTNVTEPCLRFGVVRDAICDDPGHYMFWDTIHPTVVVHRILAEEGLAALRP